MNDNGGARSNGVVSRLWTLITMDMPGLLGAGLLALISGLPAILCAAFGIVTHSLLPLLVGGPIGGMLAAPQLCGLADIVLRILRGDMDSWWYSYRRAWKRNAVPSLLPGAVGGLVFGVQLFTLAHAGSLHLGPAVLISMLVGVLLSTAIALWFLPQLALIELPPQRMLLNAILLVFRYPLRTLGASVLLLVYFGSLALAFPFSLVFAILLNFWLPTLLALSMLHGPLEETFRISERISEAQDGPEDGEQ